MGRLPLLAAVFLGYTSMTAGAATLGAQTRFAKRDTVANLSKYTNVEECYQGMERVIRTEIKKLPYWIDTVEVNGRESFDSLPRSVKKFSAECLKKFNPDSVNLKDYDLWISLFLGAGNDEVVEKIVARKLSSLTWNPDSGSDSLGREILGVIGRYRQARPVRYEMIGTLVDSYLNGPQKPTYARDLLMLYRAKANMELASGDTVSAKEWAQKVQALIETPPSTLIDSIYFAKESGAVRGAVSEIMRASELEDSLKISGNAYAGLRRSFWKNARVSQSSDILSPMVGEKAAPLIGRYVYSRDGVLVDNPANSEGEVNHATSYPTNGKLSLVVFLYGGCREDTPIPPSGLGRATFRWMCLNTYTLMNRLANRYPNLEVVIVSRTMGYLGQEGPFEPKVEADMLKSWWLDNHKLPARLVIAETEFFRLPAPDNRRLDSQDPNADNYRKLRLESSEIRNASFFLIDTDGTIIESSRLDVDGERRIKSLLDVIKTRK